MLIFELIVTFLFSGLILYGFWHEERFIEFERAAWKAIKRRFRK